MSKQNVFAALGLPDDSSTVEAWRSDLARVIRECYVRSRCTQDQFAQTLGVKQSVVSKVVNGRIGSLSVEFLLRLCVKLQTRGRAFWGPSPDEAFVTTDVSVPTGTETSFGELEIPGVQTMEHAAAVGMRNRDVREKSKRYPVN